MSKIRAISGFPEWLPYERIFEEQKIDTLKKLARSFGFLPVETAAVELISTLASKGSTDKEIFALKRLAAEESEESELALHFDLTVPFSRYVALNLQNLIFPFKRYQIQKAWRGERPQKGRFREFYQCDFDIIARDELDLTADAEVFTLIDLGFEKLAVAKHKISLGSRKLLLGFYSSLGIEGAVALEVIRVVDKLHKIGAEKVTTELLKLQLSQAQADSIVSFCDIKTGIAEADQLLRSRFSQLNNALFSQGIDEIARFAALLSTDTISRAELDCSLARGLDYYTGIIFEVRFPDFPEYGSVGAGGRYDNLAASFTTAKLPGVGGTIGLSRIMDCAIKQNLVSATSSSYITVLVSLYNQEQAKSAFELASQLRANDISCEVYLKPVKLGKQIEYASAKGIKYVIFINENELQVKNLETKEQDRIDDLTQWISIIKDKN